MAHPELLLDGLHDARRTIALLGPNGINVVIRLSAFILLCIGIQILWTGYSTLVLGREP